MPKVADLRAFSAFRVRICRKLRHPPSLYLDTNNRNSKGEVTFAWGFTPPYDFYPTPLFFTPFTPCGNFLPHPVTPLLTPFTPCAPPLTPPHFGMGSFYNKGVLFCNYVIPHPLSDLASLPIFEEAALQADLYSLI